MIPRLALLLLAAWAWVAEAAPAWRVQFFHDEDKSQFAINDFCFTSPQRGIAVGLLIKAETKSKPMSILTRDGGKTWEYLPLKESPISLFFLSETDGWLVTANGIWFSNEAGRSWRKLSKPDNVLRVYFLTPQHGFAVGVEKTFLETIDGGTTWKPVLLTSAPDTSREFTAYTWIAFLNAKVGMVVGRAKRPEARRTPEWMDPRGEEAPERPSLSILVETRNAGESWDFRTVSLFGRISRLRFEPSGRSLALFEFDNFFRWPSEIMKLDIKSGASTRVLARKDFAATDITIAGPAYAAGYEPTGRVARLPVPGKVRVFRSNDLDHWEQMAVDYRAVANRVITSAVDEQNIWIATDAGMILKLAFD